VLVAGVVMLAYRRATDGGFNRPSVPAQEAMAERKGNRS